MGNLGLRIDTQGDAEAATADASLELLDATEVCMLLGGTRPIDRSTLYRGMAAGRFPLPIAVGGQSRRWLKAEVLGVIRAARLARDNVEAGA